VRWGGVRGWGRRLQKSKKDGSLCSDCGGEWKRIRKGEKVGGKKEIGVQVVERRLGGGPSFAKKSSVSDVGMVDERGTDPVPKTGRGKKGKEGRVRKKGECRLRLFQKGGGGGGQKKKIHKSEGKIRGQESKNLRGFRCA